MNSTWEDFLRTEGAIFEDGIVQHFGNPDLELKAAQAATVAADLSHLGLINVSGADATGFLQGQFTNDVTKLNSSLVQYSALCSPQGRMLANFLVWQDAGSYFLQLHPGLSEAIATRLARFVLRAQVLIKNRTNDWIRVGIAGQNAAEIVRPLVPSLPEGKMHMVKIPELQLIRLDEHRFQINSAVEQAPQLWKRLAASAQVVGQATWDWLSIQSGIPEITPATQDKFVPQMINFELIDGISFKKGCYTGQEIVARTHYLGKLKRRMYRAHVGGVSAPQAGDPVFSADLGDQASGIVVNAARAPGGGFDVLASIQISSANTETLHWKTPNGELLTLQPLPYPV